MFEEENIDDYSDVDTTEDFPVNLDDDLDDDELDEGLDSPTDSDEYVMNEDDCADPGDPYDIEYDR